MSSMLGQHQAESPKTGMHREEEFRATLEGYIAGYRRTQWLRTRVGAANETRQAVAAKVWAAFLMSNRVQPFVAQAWIRPKSLTSPSE